MNDIALKKQIARALLAEGMLPVDYALEPTAAELMAAPQLMVDLSIPFPNGLEPIPTPRNPRPDPQGELPRADVLVVTWTVAEQNALADVLTPGFGRTAWYRYAHNFDAHFDAQIRAGAPAKAARRLGSWFPTRIGGKNVICFKSELHLNQDGIPTGSGTATLPVREMFLQLIDEVKPQVVITVGTAGGVYQEHDLGDVVVTRGAKFRLSDEFQREEFGKPGKNVFKSDWNLPTQHFGTAEQLMQRFAANLQEPDFAPPTKRYPFAGAPIPAPPNVPNIIKDDGHDMPEFHPILTTDFFEFGTSGNHLEQEGCAVEMGDAVLGLACADLVELGKTPPKWVVVRNLSDPQINADLPTTPRALNMQAHWAVWYYEKYGYWTSVNSALATWAIVAGL